MEVSIKTAVLQDLVNKAIKGAGNDKVMPITQLIGIELIGQNLYLSTTDGENHLTVYDKVITAEGDSAFCVSAETFSKLVAKTTCEQMFLKKEGNSLKVRGNGTYTFAIAADEENTAVVMPQATLFAGEKIVKEFSTKVKDLKDAFAIGKTAVATNNSTPCFIGYYFYENGSVTSDGSKAAYLKKKIFDTPVLLSSAFMNLGGLLTGEEVNVLESEERVYFSTNGMMMCGKKMAEVAQFPIESIIQFTEAEFPHTVKLNKTALLNVLDRVALFIGTYDRNCVRLNFSENGVLVADLHAASAETIKGEGDLKEFSALLDVESLKTMLSANTEEAIILSYGNPQAIKMKFGDAVQILSTQIEDGEGAAK